VIKIGVVGIGSMGKNHVRVCSELESIDLVGICDIDKKLTSRIATTFGTTAFSDYKTLIGKVDAVIVATPTITHYKIAKDFLKAGKHVLVEKPISSTIEDGKELITLAEKDDMVLAVGHIERHNPVVQFMKDAVQDKRFGQLITLESKRVSNFPGRIKDIGVIFDLGIHDIDIMRYLAGEIKSVYATAGTFTKNIGFEDHAIIVLTFENGICGVIEVNWLTPMKIRKLFLTCSGSFVEMDYMSQSITISSSSFKKVNELDLYHVPIESNITQISLEKKEPLKNEIEDFIGAIQDTRKPLVSGADGLRALQIAAATEKSYKRGEVIIT